MQADVEVLRFPGIDTKGESGTTPAAEEFTIDSAWGVTVEAVARQAAFEENAPLPGVLDLSGEWWCLASAADGRRLVIADRFGMQPLAVATATTLDGPALFVGTSAAATARAVRAAGGTITTDWAHVLETITARHDFLDCLFDNSTPFDGIVLIPAGRGLEVAEDRWRIVRRPELDDSGTYDSLLREGIDRVIADIRHLVVTHENVAINLSGGKDSRVVLALVLAAGCADQVHVAATDPTPPGGSIAHSPTVQSDLEISSRLVQGLGLSWVDWRTPRDMWPTSLEGELHRFQSLRHGLTNQFVPMGLTYHLTSPEARVNGAGGEIYRGYWAGVLSKHPLWTKLGHNEDSLEDDSRALLRALRSPLPLPPELAHRGEESFLSSMFQLPGTTLADRLERHYEAFRMRGHAGGRRWGQSYGITNVGLLQQAALMRAAHALPPEDRYSGRILFDIVEALAPELNDLEYQSGPWPWGGGRFPVRSWEGIRSSESGYRRAQKAAQLATRPQRYRARPRPDMLPAIDAGLRAVSAQMAEDDLDPGLLTGLRTAPPTDLRGQGRLLARLFHWASGFGDDRFLPRAIPTAPPRVRTCA